MSTPESVFDAAARVVYACSEPSMIVKTRVAFDPLKLDPLKLEPSCAG